MIVVIGIPCLHRGGTEMQTLQLVKALRDEGLSAKKRNFKVAHPFVQQVWVVCYFEFDSQVVGEFVHAGAKVELLGLARSITPWEFISVVSNTFGRIKPQATHIQYMSPGFLAIVAARVAGGGKILATVHQPWTPSHHGAKAKILLRGAAWMCHSFICVSEATEQSWFGVSQIYSPGKPRTSASSSWGARHYTIHNTIDISQVDQILSSVTSTDLRKILGFSEAIVIGAVSRLSWEKGIDVLLEAFALLCKGLDQAGDGNNVAPNNVESGRKDRAPRQLRVELLIVGDGQERVRLEEQADALGLCSTDFRGWKSKDAPERNSCGASVVWVGKRTWEEAIKLMSLMDIFVVPSRFEGFGLTAAEAMACGKPVVAADVGGLSEVVGRDNSCGRLYLAENAESLAQELMDLALSRSKREGLGKSGRARVVKLFGFEKFSKSIKDLYQELCDK